MQQSRLAENEQQSGGEIRTTVQISTDGSGRVFVAPGEFPLFLFTFDLEPILDEYQFQQPIELAALPDGSLLIAEQRGSITRFVETEDGVEQFGVLDLTDAVRFGGEEGLLSFALDPQFESDPYLYVYYSPREGGRSRLSRFLIMQGAAIPASELVIIEIGQPYPNHNGGAVRFGPDGMLYLGIGDGGAANDPHGHGQNTETLLGTIIRLDVSRSDTAEPYRIPLDNPFVGVEGVLPEIYAYGLRNPWRMSFDLATGRLWVGDVGQNAVEEIAIVGAGSNQGWRVFEGDRCFASQDRCDALEAVPPVAVYNHDEGCSVTGGVVYRGKDRTSAAGGDSILSAVAPYFFADYCSGRVWGLWEDPDAATGWSMTEVLHLDARIVSFAHGPEGEVHILTFNGPILKLTHTRPGSVSSEAEPD